MIVNGGQTPAHGVTSWMNYQLDKFPLNVVLGGAPDISMRSKFVIAPHAEIHHEIPMEDKLNLAEIQTIRDQSAAIYVWGEINYFDAFEERRLSRFRLMCIGENMSNGKLIPCEEGNEAN